MYTIEEFSAAKRDRLLDYKVYAENFFESAETVEVVRAQLRQPAETLAAIPLPALLEATSGLAWEAIDHLTNLYSGGHSLDDLRELFPIVVDCWEAYNTHQTNFQNSVDGGGSSVATLPLAGNGFYRANRLVSLGIVLGHTDLLQRVVPIVDYNNSTRDGMLERLWAPFVANRGQLPDECIRHLPYFKTLKIFKAKQVERPILMAKYLADWYQASRREPYYDSHKRGVAFRGYWSWESAAITTILDIDDATYRDAEFYPRDLVTYARSLSTRTRLPSPEPDIDELRVIGGDVCPRTGYWSTPAKQDSRAFYELGRVMPIFSNSSYGATIWQWDDDQQ